MSEKNTENCSQKAQGEDWAPAERSDEAVLEGISVREEPHFSRNRAAAGTSTSAPGISRKNLTAQVPDRCFSFEYLLQFPPVRRRSHWGHTKGE